MSKKDPQDQIFSACKKHQHKQENQSAPTVQHHQKALSAMVWAPAGYVFDSITTKAVPMDSLRWIKKARQTQDNF